MQRCLARARLPRWCLAADWPQPGGRPALADLWITQASISAITPSAAPCAGAWDLAGAPVLPGLVDAHTHLDKAFTSCRIGAVKPGLLGAIESMAADRQGWTSDDVYARASRALEWAYGSGVVQLRTHVDWWESGTTPLAWAVLAALASEWAGRITLERVSLSPLAMYATRAHARALARQVALGGAGARLGGFVHSVNWDAQALRHLFEAAQEFDLDVDLHCDEELNPSAVGLASTARLLGEIGYRGRVVCGHVCALAAQPQAQALATLDAVARAPITLIALPITNLLLQDAQTGRTPRLRGITLVQEARERGIPVLIASDNVQDAFCRIGSFDPLEALGAAVLAAQLEQPFDVWTESICRADWLQRKPGPAPLQPGSRADLVVFNRAEAHSWPARSQCRVVLRGGQVVAGDVPEEVAHWQAGSAQPG